VTVITREVAATPRRVVVFPDAAPTPLVMHAMSSRQFRFIIDVEAAFTPLPEMEGARPPLLVSDLAWSREQAAAVRAQLAAFEEGWDSPAMDAYDAL
jgi:hypothetical protein